MLIKIAGLQKPYILVSSYYLCNELCMEHPRTKISVKGFKMCSFRFQDFQKPCILIASHYLCKELCMGHSCTNMHHEGFKLCSFQWQDFAKHCIIMSSLHLCKTAFQSIALQLQLPPMRSAHLHSNVWFQKISIPPHRYGNS